MTKTPLKGGIDTFIKSLKEGSVKDIYWFNAAFTPKAKQMYDLPITSGLKIDLVDGITVYITGGCSSGMNFMQILIYSPEGVLITDDEFDN